CRQGPRPFGARPNPRRPNAKCRLRPGGRVPSRPCRTALQALSELTAAQRTGRCLGRSTGCKPNTLGKAPLFGAYDIGIDCGGTPVSMPKPSLNQIYGHAGLEGGVGETMPKPLGRGLLSVNIGSSHNRPHMAIAGHTAPSTDSLVMLKRGCSRLEARKKVRGFRRDRHDPVTCFISLF